MVKEDCSVLRDHKIVPKITEEFLKGKLNQCAFHIFDCLIKSVHFEYWMN